MKIVKSIEASIFFIKDKNKTKEQKCRFLSILLSTSGISLLGSWLIGNLSIFFSLSLCFNCRCISICVFASSLLVFQ